MPSASSALRQSEHQVRGRPYPSNRPSTSKQPPTRTQALKGEALVRKRSSKNPQLFRKQSIRLRVHDCNQTAEPPVQTISSPHTFFSNESNLPSSSSSCPINHYNRIDQHVKAYESPVSTVDEDEGGLKPLLPVPPPVTLLACADHPESRQLVGSSASSLVVHIIVLWLTLRSSAMRCDVARAVGSTTRPASTRRNQPSRSYGFTSPPFSSKFYLESTHKLTRIAGSDRRNRC